MNLISTHFGEALALATAVVWSLSVILFKKSGETVHPLGLNLFKDALAVVLLLPTLWLAGDSLFRPVPWQDYGLMLLSGVLGIGLADTLFFMSLNVLGAGLSAIVDCLYSPSLIGLSMIFLGERLRPWQLVGAALIISAVLGVTIFKNPGGVSRKHLVLGTLWASAAMLLMAAGVVMIKPLLERSPLLWASEIRLIGGVLVLVPMVLLHRQRKVIVASMLSRQGVGYTLSGSFLGAYVSMILWLGGMKFTQASTAAALNQTSNIFVFLFAALLLREPINLQRALAIVLGVAGVYLVTFA